MLTRWRRAWHAAAARVGRPGRLRRARGGNVAIIFAFSMLPILAFTGTVIDYGLATRLEAKLQAATDASALRLCQMDPASATLTVLQGQAGLLMTGFMGAVSVTVDPLSLTASPRKIRVTTHAVSKTYFGKLTGVANPVVTASAQCASAASSQIYEIALVLDTTGSMANSAGTQTKMQAVQQAASDFVDYVYSSSAFGAGTRIAIVPFAAAVAVDPVANRYKAWIDKSGVSRYHWNNIEHPGSGFTSRFDVFDATTVANTAWKWPGCLETLPYPQNVQDGYSTSNDNLYVPMFAPDESGTSTTFSYNSYLDDYTNNGFFGFFFPSNCTAYSISGYGNDSQARACKYKYPSNPAAIYASGTTLANGPGYLCTSKPLLQLTSNTTTMKSLIASLSPSGSTNIFEGVMWGWRTLSPTSVFGDGASYSSSTTKKMLVLMTDGTNSWNANSGANKSDYSSFGYILNADGTSPNSRLPPSNQNLTDSTSTRAALDTLTQAACTNAKAANVVIYTIAFSTPGDPIDTTGINMLAACASPTAVLPNGTKAFVANDASGLKAAFSSISAGVGKVRLSQ